MKSKKKDKRLAYNFLLSYYEVYQKLPDLESKNLFITAVCEKQFNGIDVPLEGIAEFAYISQRHAIEKSRQGWVDVSKRDGYTLPSIPPSEGSSIPPSIPPSVQEKEEEKEEDIYIIDFDGLLSYINNAFGRKFTVVSNAVKVKYKSLLKQGYKKDQIISAINNCKNDSFHKDKNYQYCTIEYFSRSATIDKYGDVSTKDTRLIMSHPTIID